MFRSVVVAMATAILLTVVADLLLPEGNLRRYAGPVTGLLVLLAILTPILKIDISLPDLFSQEQGTDEILEDSAALSERYEALAETDYDQTLCDQLEALALLAPGVKTAKAEKNKDGITLYIESEGDATQKIYSLAEAFCGLGPETLTIASNPE